MAARKLKQNRESYNMVGMDRRYRRMVERMAVKSAAKKKKKNKAQEPHIPEEPWFLYILECSDRSFYTGITKDITVRVKKHNSGKGASYTRSRRPVKLIYQETCADRTSALVREFKVKSLPRKRKEELVYPNSQ